MGMGMMSAMGAMGMNPAMAAMGAMGMGGMPGAIPPGAPDHARQVVDRAPAHHPGAAAAHPRPRGGAAARVRALALGREVRVGQRLRTTSRR